MHAGKFNVVSWTMAVGVIAGMSGVVTAQQAPPVPTSGSSTTAGELIEEVVITGSRIVRSDYVAQSPIVTVDIERAQATAAVTLEKGLNELPQFVPSQSETSNGAGGAGQAKLNLRGLGNQRTLVLLDGRRMQPSSDDSSVDITTIPAALIENIEVITGGASAVYGSDAIAGVVNFRLKRDFEGIQVDTKYGDSVKGDYGSKEFAVTMGGKFADDLGRAVLSVGYADRERLLGRQRDFFGFAALSSSLPGGIAPRSTNTQYTQAAVNQVFAQYGVAPGTVNVNTNAIGFNADGTLFSTNAVVTNFRYSDSSKDPSSRYYISPNNVVQDRSFLDRQIRTPQTRYSAFGKAEYNLTDDTVAFIQANYIGYRTATQIDPTGANASVGLLVNPANTFVPADFRVLLASRANPNQFFTLQKRLVELGNRVNNFDHQTFQTTVGVNGKLPFRDWTWELFGSYGEDQTKNVTTGYGSLTAYNTLLGATDGGQSICVGGYNPFGEGRTISAQCRAYLDRTISIATRFEQNNVAANIQGGLFNLPAGELRLAAGAEYRRNTYDYQPDETIASGDVINIAQQVPTGGSVNSREGYIELLAPLLKDLPFIESLNLDLAYRTSDYNTVGRVGTYKTNIDWTLGKGVMLRGGVQRAIRAPALGELYQAPSAGLQAVGGLAAGAGDPCDTRSVYRTGANAARVRALCLAQGVPAAFIDTYQFTGNNTPATTAGNPGLKEETANSWTLGGVYQPRFDSPLLSRFSASVDYYNIKIDDAVAALSLQQLFAFCFNASGTTNPAYSQSNQFCAPIQRQSTNGITSYGTLVQQFNLATFQTEGIDLQIDWGVDLKDIFASLPGTLDVNLAANRSLGVTYQALPTAPGFDYMGSIGSGLADGGTFPKWKAQLNLTYTLGAADVGVKMRHISAMKDSTKVTNPASIARGVPGYNYFDLLAGYRINDMLRVRAGMSNVFDKGPPIVGEVLGETDAGTYDIFGRTYFVSLRAKF